MPSGGDPVVQLCAAGEKNCMLLCVLECSLGRTWKVELLIAACWESSDVPAAVWLLRQHLELVAEQVVWVAWTGPPRQVTSKTRRHTSGRWESA